MQVAFLLALVTSATPAPGNDDRQQLEVDFNSACQQGVDLVIPAGRYDVTRKQTPAGTAIASLRFRCDREIRVVCQGATLAFKGPALLPNETSPRAWTLMELGGRTRVSGCSFDGNSKEGPTSEQTHLVQVIGPYFGGNRDLVDSHFSMAAGAYRAGDSIRIIGESSLGAGVIGFHMENLEMPVNHRSAIGVQRGVSGLIGRYIRTGIVGDAAVDYEQTGFGHGEDHLWEFSTFARGPNAQGTVTFSIGGYPTAATYRVTLRKVVILDGGVYMVNAHDTLIEDSTVIQSHNDSALSISQGSNDNTIRRSLLTRGGTGPVIHSYHQAGLGPIGLTLDQADIRHTGIGKAVAYESSSNLTWSGGFVSIMAGLVCGLHVSSASAPVAGLIVSSSLLRACPFASVFYQGDVYSHPVGPYLWIP